MGLRRPSVQLSKGRSLSYPIFIHRGHDHGEATIFTAGFISSMRLSMGIRSRRSYSCSSKNSIPGRSQQVYSSSEKSDAPIDMRMKLKAMRSGSKHSRRSESRSASLMRSRL